MRVTLPEDITCVCLAEHDLGVFAANIPCHLCNKLCDSLDTLNKHIASVHRISHILVGHNIIFEKPDVSVVKPGFFCPMVKCKYHIAESFQTKYFKNFKLLKQHYTKVHASKDFPCSLCQQRFASKTYLDIHSKTCGRTFQCEDCGCCHQSLESLQTHCRRKSHQLSNIYKRVKPSPGNREPDLGRQKFSVVATGRKPGEIPIAPRPSPHHINAAIALSELSATKIFTPRADIGIQTDCDRDHHWRQKKSSSPLEQSGTPRSPLVTTETQTKAGSRKRAWRPDKVSSLVQTTGEITVRAKVSRLSCEPSQTNTETQCKMSPDKKLKSDSCSVTTMTNMCNVLDLCQVDIPDCDYLWPLRSNTNGTQTSPRVSRLVSQISDDTTDKEEEEELTMPGLETVEMMSKTKLGETRQFSTETQTELDIFLENYDSGLTDVEKLLTTEIQTQTHEDDDSLLLFASNYTQTGTEDFLSALIIGGDRQPEPQSLLPNPPPVVDCGSGGGGGGGNPFKLDYVCSAETQTSLTGFQENNLLLQQVMETRSLDTTETQTHDEIVSFMEM